MLQKFRITGALAIWLAAPMAAAAPLTFQQAVDAALARSLDAQRAALAVDQAAADLAVLGYENDAKLTPQAVITDHRPRGPGTPAAVTAGAPRDQTYSLTLSRTLYDFGRHSTKMEQGTYTRDVKTLAKDEVAEALRFKVARAYAALAAAEQATSVSQNQIEISTAKVKAQQDDYKRGLRPEGDVVTAQVDLGRAKLTLSKVKDNARAARLALGLLMGLERPDAFALTLPPSPLAAKNPAHLQQIVAAWGGFRRNATQARRAMEKSALEADQELIYATKRPTLSGGLVASRAGAWGSQNNLANVYYGQLALSWDIPWDGMSRDEVQRVTLHRQDLDLQDAVDLKVRRDKEAVAEDNLRAGAEQYEEQAAQVKLGTRQRTLVEQRYKAGKASAFELSTAESDLLTQELDLINTLSTLEGAAIDVAEARGVNDLGGIFQ